ncbi:hypothetical protein GYMLUDRAFT_44541 [Collybiopsis luxurians FD-317 M1]|uniref:Phosphoglycerate mutase-like protein n=1 Tax=Collybiopsis luxurians FD-317 M1 TaxID=944289 RepID=A0A0D0BVM5_9AGAR|nr:hypothetical protein GYMLUDRAFT_44541 [Collybiopsis luxurians FD-317 M1]
MVARSENASDDDHGNPKISRSRLWSFSSSSNSNSALKNAQLAQGAVPSTGKWRCLVLSLVRHGQAASNTQGWRAGPDSPLTCIGNSQVESLALSWSRVRITKLVSSHLQRAVTTAKTISALNVSRPPVWIDRTVQEQLPGALAPKLFISGKTREGSLALGRVLVEGKMPRDHVPPEGGESLNMVAERAKNFLLGVMMEHAMETEMVSTVHAGPQEFDSEMWKLGGDPPEPAKMPPGIPHVVVVSHNVFLGELYETMYYWNSTERADGLWCHWKNATWTRHILWIRDRYSDSSSSYDFEFQDLLAPMRKDGASIARCDP